MKQKTKPARCPICRGNTRSHRLAENDSLATICRNCVEVQINKSRKDYRDNYEQKELAE